MKLTDRDPRFVTEGGRRIGIRFDCPCATCLSSGSPTQLRVMVDPPFDSGPTGTHAWQRTGDTFEDITLTPSIDASETGHWHGYLTAGELT